MCYGMYFQIFAQETFPLKQCIFLKNCRNWKIPQQMLNSSLKEQTPQTLYFQLKHALDFIFLHVNCSPLCCSCYGYMGIVAQWIFSANVLFRSVMQRFDKFYVIHNFHHFWQATWTLPLNHPKRKDAEHKISILQIHSGWTMSNFN